MDKGDVTTANGNSILIKFQRVALAHVEQRVSSQAEKLFSSSLTRDFVTFSHTVFDRRPLIPLIAFMAYSTYTCKCMLPTRT
jgi:hypothetical protein